MGQGFAALRQGAHEDAKAIFEERMGGWREIGNQTGMGLSLVGFAALALACSFIGCRTLGVLQSMLECSCGVRGRGLPDGQPNMMCSQRDGVNPCR